MPARIRVPVPALVIDPEPDIAPFIVLDGLVVFTDRAAMFETVPVTFSEALLIVKFAVTFTPLVAA